LQKITGFPSGGDGDLSMAWINSTLTYAAVSLGIPRMC